MNLENVMDDEKLDGGLSALTDALGWVSVEDRMPEDGQSVAFVVRSSGHFGYLDGTVLGGIYLANRYTGGFSVPGLTVDAWFWMPLPPPPND